MKIKHPVFLFGIMEIDEEIHGQRRKNRMQIKSILNRVQFHKGFVSVAPDLAILPNKRKS